MRNQRAKESLIRYYKDLAKALEAEATRLEHMEGSNPQDIIDQSDLSVIETLVIEAGGAA